jgi:Uma2 family endonuclease
MQALWLEVPESFLEERRRLGHDKKDELWDGVLHMAPSPGMLHQRMPPRLVRALTPVADRLGLEWFFDNTSLFGPGENWRVPDLTLARPEHVSERGLERAELVVEVLSPNDESRKKLPFYAKIGVCEVWLLEPTTRACEMFALVEGVLAPVAGGVSPVLGVRLETIEGPMLRIHDGATFLDV